MKCPNCSLANPEGMRFCGHCGSPLATPLLEGQPPQQEIPPQLVSKILSQVKTLDGERRKVTVVFADISGYTSMSEEMDPEDLTNLANEVFRRLGKVIYRYEGIIDKYMGDCVMAIFGAPVAHEDDPERALRAALGMMDEVKEMSESVSLHVGVNSGEVIAGKIGSDLKMDYTVMGDTVNLAERLTGAAPTGEIYVSTSTYRLTRNLFDFDELDPLTLKGKTEKTDAYRLSGVKRKPGKTRGVPGLNPQFLGRDEELRTLEQNLQKVKEGASRAVFVLGEAGVGKSRLIGEFRKTSEESAKWLEGRCSSYTKAAQFFPFAQLLKEALFNNSGAKAKQRSERALGKLKAMFPERWPDVAASVDRILPLDIKEDLRDSARYLDARTLRVKTFVAIRDLLEALSEERPVVVAIDDIHWADESSQDLMRFLIETTVESSIMIIGVTRPTPGSKWETIQKETTRKLPARTDTIDLERLSREEMDQLIDLLLEGPVLSRETRVGILEKSGGSPFYLEEIIKDLIEAHVLSRKEDGWVCETGTSKVAIPESVEAVIASRIDKLSPKARSLVRCASVLGTDFTYRDLMCVSLSAGELEDELRELLSSGIVVKASPEKTEYRFAHTVIQEVAHVSILKASRKRLHLRAARCIEQNYGPHLERYLGALGMHYETGGDAAKAFSYYLEAGREAKGSFANREAISNFTKALACSEETTGNEKMNKQRISAVLDRAWVYRLSGETDLALEGFSEALALSRSSRENRFEARSLLGLSQTYGWTSRFPEMEKAASGALDLYRQLDDGAGESESLSQLGYARQMKGEYDAAISLYEQSLEKSTAVDNRLEQSNCLNNLGTAYCSQGDLEKGFAHFQRSLEIKKAIGDLEGEAANLHNLGYIQLTLGNKEEALSLFTQSLELKERIGDRAGAAVTMNSLGAVFITMGRYDEGLLHCRRALKAREEVGDRRGQGYTLQNMSRVLTLTGPVEEALDALKCSLTIMEEVNDREGQALALASLGKVCTDSLDYEDARKYLDRARAIADEIGASRVLSIAVAELALRALLCGEQTEAEELVELVGDLVDDSSTPEMKAIYHWLSAGLGAIRGDISRANASLSSAAAAAEEGVDRALAARWTFHLASVLEAAGAGALSDAQLKSSIDVFTQLGAALWLEKNPKG